jgi:hypothetical protein
VAALSGIIIGIRRLLRVIIQILTDFGSLVWLFLRHSRAMASENLFLRKQLAMYQERGVKPRRPSATKRVSLVVLSRCFDWRDALVVVGPRTLTRWHRAGFRLFWRYKSRSGRPPIPVNCKRSSGKWRSKMLRGVRYESRTSCS